MEETNVMSLEEKHNHLQDVAHRIWCMWGGPQGINDALDLGRISKDDHELLWMVLELYPAWLQKWRMGHMSLAEILANPIEKVEAEIEGYTSRLEKYISRVDEGISFLTMNEVKGLAEGTVINTGKHLLTVREVYDPFSGKIGMLQNQRVEYFLPVAFALRATLDLDAKACSYCGHWCSAEHWYYNTLYVNGDLVTQPFCKDKDCWHNAQTSAEG